MAQSDRLEGRSWRESYRAGARASGTAFDWGFDDVSGREVTDKAKRLRDRIAKDQATLSALEALRADMRAAKAKTVGDLPADVRDRYRAALEGGWMTLGIL